MTAATRQWPSLIEIKGTVIKIRTAAARAGVARSTAGGHSVVSVVAASNRTHLILQPDEYQIYVPLYHF